MKNFQTAAQLARSQWGKGGKNVNANVNANVNVASKGSLMNAKHSHSKVFLKNLHSHSHSALNRNVEDETVENLVRTFSAEHCRNYFHKVVKNLTPNEIFGVAEKAKSPKVSCPVAYFNAATKRIMRDRGIE